MRFKFKFNPKIIFVLGILASCDGNATSPQAVQKSIVPSVESAETVSAGAITFKFNTIKQKITDSDAPLGRWKIDKTYPVIQSVSNPAVAAALNKQIEALVHQYGCKNKCDEGFNGEVTLANKHLFSMRYEMMWMCSAMPHPDSTQGALNYDLTKNTPITLDTEFSDDAQRMAFTAMALKRLNQAINAHSEKSQMQCPAATGLGRFYVTTDTIVISSQPIEHADSACEAEVALQRSNVAVYLKPTSALR